MFYVQIMVAHSVRYITQLPPTIVYTSYTKFVHEAEVLMNGHMYKLVFTSTFFSYLCCSCMLSNIILVFYLLWNLNIFINWVSKTYDGQPINKKNHPDGHLKKKKLLLYFFFRETKRWHQTLVISLRFEMQFSILIFEIW